MVRNGENPQPDGTLVPSVGIKSDSVSYFCFLFRLEHDRYPWIAVIVLGLVRFGVNKISGYFEFATFFEVFFYPALGASLYPGKVIHNLI
jgi:hypothetical protein